ncbi:MAG: FtsQ-type POTRA domain-containing protein [Oscillospiraceae bacterium]|nr:FtsQ-type POTRA domain-containing protein [Oscillospiraceae bacterium]
MPEQNTERKRRVRKLSGIGGEQTAEYRTERERSERSNRSRSESSRRDSGKGVHTDSYADRRRSERPPSAARVEEERRSYNSSDRNVRTASETRQTKRKSGGRSSTAALSPKTRTALYQIAIAAVCVGVFAVVCIFVFFNIKQVKVVSDDSMYYRDVDILKICGFSEGQNMFSLDCEEAERRIEDALVYVENCTIKRKIPSTVEIHIESAKPVGIICFDDGNQVIVSRKGKLLESLRPIEAAIGGSPQANTSSTDIVSSGDMGAEDNSGGAADSSSSEEDEEGLQSEYIDTSALIKIRMSEVTVNYVDKDGYLSIDSKVSTELLGEFIDMLESKEVMPKEIKIYQTGYAEIYYEERIVFKFNLFTDLQKQVQLARALLDKEVVSEYERVRIDVTNTSEVIITPEYQLQMRGNALW